MGILLQSLTPSASAELREALIGLAVPVLRDTNLQIFHGPIQRAIFLYSNTPRRIAQRNCRELQRRIEQSIQDRKQSILLASKWT